MNDANSNLFDKFHREYAGDRSGPCPRPQHNEPNASGRSGCCAFGAYLQYTLFVEKIDDILGGDESLLDSVSLWRRRNSSSDKVKHVARQVLVQTPMVEKLTTYVATCVGPPPQLIHVELDHCQAVAKVPHKSDYIPEHVSSWNGCPEITVKCGSSLTPTVYGLSSVVFSNYSHWVSIIIDENGGKWTYDSLQHDGRLQFISNEPYSPRDCALFGEKYTARNVLWLLLRQLEVPDAPTLSPLSFTQLQSQSVYPREMSLQFWPHDGCKRTTAVFLTTMELALVQLRLTLSSKSMLGLVSNSRLDICEQIENPPVPKSSEVDMDFFTRTRIFKSGDSIHYVPKNPPYNHYANVVQNPVTTILLIKDEDTNMGCNVVVELENGDTLFIGPDHMTGFAGPGDEGYMPLYETSLWEVTCPKQRRAINKARKKRKLVNMGNFVRELKEAGKAAGLSGLVRDNPMAELALQEETKSRQDHSPTDTTTQLSPCKTLCYDSEIGGMGWYWVTDQGEARNVIAGDCPVPSVKIAPTAPTDVAPTHSNFPCFEALHRYIAGVDVGSCIIPAHANKSVGGCCGNGADLPYSLCIDKLATTLEGDTNAWRAVTIIHLHNDRRPMDRHVACASYSGVSMSTDVENYFRRCRGKAPQVLHVEVYPRGERVFHHERGRLENFDRDDVGVPLLRLRCPEMHRSDLTYALSSVVYGTEDDGRCAAIHLDGSGGKWKFESDQNRGVLEFVGQDAWTCAEGDDHWPGLGYHVRVLVWILAPPSIHVFVGDSHGAHTDAKTVPFGQTPVDIHPPAQDIVLSPGNRETLKGEFLDASNDYSADPYSSSASSNLPALGGFGFNSPFTNGSCMSDADVLSPMNTPSTPQTPVFNVQHSYPVKSVSYMESSTDVDNDQWSPKVTLSDDGGGPSSGKNDDRGCGYTTREHQTRRHTLADPHMPPSPALNETYACSTSEQGSSCISSSDVSRTASAWPPKVTLSDDGGGPSGGEIDDGGCGSTTREHQTRRQTLSDPHLAPSATLNETYAFSTSEQGSSCISSSDVSRTASDGVFAPVVGTEASFILPGWHSPVFVDLTEQLKTYKPLIPHSTAEAYYQTEFKLAMQLLRPFVENLPGGDNFFKMLLGRETPRLWSGSKKLWPPFADSANPGNEFGLNFHCDHRRTSGCDIGMKIVRPLGRYPNRDMYKITMARGWHRYACNHHQTYNHGKHYSPPVIHPMVNLFIRKRCKRDQEAGKATVWRLIEQDLIKYLRVTPALHCTYPHASEEYQRERDKQKKICNHVLVQSHISSEDGYSDAVRMPPTIPVPKRNPDKEDDNVGKLNVRTSDMWTTIHHMLIEDGHSDAGSFVFQPHVVKQAKSCIHKWNLYFGGKSVISPTATADSSVGAMHQNFNDNNLFAQWGKMISKKDRKKGDPGLLDPFQWNTLGICYAETSTKTNVASKKRNTPVPPSPGPELEFAESFMEPDPESSTAYLQYNCVVVYGCLVSLMVGVKAWAMRDISGRVQFCADNMYNCLKGVPNMYWFNVGIMDAKGIHFPTVQALTLGRKKPRNKVHIPCPCNQPS